MLVVDRAHTAYLITAFVWCNQFNQGQDNRINLFSGFRRCFPSIVMKVKKTGGTKFVLLAKPSFDPHSTKSNVGIWGKHELHGVKFNNDKTQVKAM